MLPVQAFPEFKATIPSTGQEIKFRPFTVKEQKVLLFAVQSEDAEDVVSSVEKILTNCILDPIDVRKLASFDIEYLFLQIRGKSIGEVLEFRIRHGESNECKHTTDIGVNLEDIKVEMPTDFEKFVMLREDLGITLKFPSLDDTPQLLMIMDDVTKFIDFLTTHVENVFDTEQVYDNFTLDEMVEFIESLSTSQFEKIVEWYQKLPTLSHTIDYVCPKCGNPETIVLRGLSDFFT